MAQESPPQDAEVAEKARARAAALKQQGKLEEALDVYREALAADPGHARTYFHLGSLLFDLGRMEAAVAYWRKSVELEPEHFAGIYNVALGLRRLDRRDEAMAMFRQAIALAPQRPDSYLQLVAMEREKGRHEASLEIYRQLLAAVPGSPDALAGIASVDEALGRTQEAYETLRPLVEGGTQHLGVVTTFALVCHRIPNPSPAAATFLESQLARADLRGADRKRVLTGLATLHDVLGNAERAFSYFTDAHRLDPVNESARRGNLALVGLQRRAYSAARLARLPRARHGSELPIFIVGMPRSGTSLVEQILASHPQVFGAGELTQIGKLALGTLDTGVPFPEYLDVITREEAERLAAGYLVRLRELAPAGATRVTDKMPLNFLHLGLIEMLFPQARVVHCRRHPLDTCLSVYCNDFKDALAFTKDLETLGRYYVQYRLLMQHWKSVLSIRMLELSYEELVAHPESVSRRLVAFCGLSWDDACLRFHETRRAVATPSYHQVRKPIYGAAVGRYRPYERFLGPLKAALGEFADER